VVCSPLLHCEALFAPPLDLLLLLPNPRSSSQLRFFTEVEMAPCSVKKIKLAFQRAVPLPGLAPAWDMLADSEWSIRRLASEIESALEREKGWRVRVAMLLNAERDRALAFHETVASCLEQGSTCFIVADVTQLKKRAHDHSDHADHVDHHHHHNHAHEHDHDHDHKHHDQKHEDHGHALKAPETNVDPAAAKIPITVLTGFLGSGKTTLLNHLLHEQRDKKIAVIENEYGEVPIDNELLSSKLSLAEQMVVLSSGCMCCTVRGDLLGALLQVQAKVSRRRPPASFFGCYPLDGVLIETTGMADPVPIVRTILQTPAILEHFRMDGVVTLVDAKNVLGRLDETDVAGAPDKGVVDEAFQQIMFSDRIVLNKVDLVPSAVAVKVWQRIRSINDRAKILSCVRGQLDPAELVGVGAYAGNAAASGHDILDDATMERDHDHGHHHHRHGDGSGSGGCHEEGCSDPEQHHHEHHDGDCCDDLNHGHDHGEGSGGSASRHNNQVGSFSLLRPGMEVGPLEFSRWVRTLSALPEEAGTLYRCKAVLAAAGLGRKLVFHAVSDVLEKVTAGPWATGEPRGCKIVFIGKRLDKAFFTAGFDATLRPVWRPLRLVIAAPAAAAAAGATAADSAVAAVALEGAATAAGGNDLLLRILQHSPGAFYRVLLNVTTADAASVGMASPQLADAVCGTEAHGFYEAVAGAAVKGHHPFGAKGFYLHGLLPMAAAASYVRAFRESKAEVCAIAGLVFSSAAEAEAAGVTWLEVCALADGEARLYVHEFAWRAETITEFFAQPDSATSSALVKIEYEIEDDDAFDEVTDVLKFRMILQPETASAGDADEAVAGGAAASPPVLENGQPEMVTMA
ncbi:unnamed protein product, partial [Phaeothamnion confervicola]